MRFAVIEKGGQRGLAVPDGAGWRGVTSGDKLYPGDLETLVAGGTAALKRAFEALTNAPPLAAGSFKFLPPIGKPPKIICVGLNYADHTKESPYEQPAYPTLFPRFASTLIGHGQPIVRPRVSEQLDYEGEMVAIIGKGGRHISKDKALDHVIGYSIFNEASIRDYQFKSPQWTVGKNFDATGAFGPSFVTADEVPPGGRDLKLETRLNGKVVQSATTSDMLFDVVTVIATVSEAITLEVNDVLVMGTPSGVGFARKPPLFMKAGDVCEVEIEKLGILSNPIVGVERGREAAMNVMQQARAGEADHATLVARAAALVPDFLERAGEADKLRKVPPENIAALKQAGLLKILQARRYGGHQASLRTHVDVIATLARGCAATAWCAGVVHAHSWMMASFPQAAQEETYGANPDAVISAVVAARGKAKQVDGGYVLDGFWPFASGSQHADYLLLGAAVIDGTGEAVDEGDLLVPVGDIVIKDDWNVGGLRGTGSCSIVAKDVFVPAHRFLSLPGLIGGETPGQRLHEGWLYKSAAVPVLTLALAPSALGTAQAALESFKKRLPGREIAYTQHEIQIDSPVTHIQAATAATKIGTAELLLHHCADSIQAAAERGEEMEFAKRARVRMDCAYAVRLCLEAVETLYLASGGSGIADTSTIQRASRDLHAINMHGLLALETNAEMYGRVVLGLTPNTPLI